VDFTILAATSVLGDLTEKCPPAEACRDAFERMSKATVQMCMSTTGFGSEAKSGRQGGSRSDVPSQSSFASMGAETNYPDLKVGQSQKQQQEVETKPHRPPPKFDMNLRDLFPDDINSDDLVSYGRQRQPQLLRQQTQPVPMPQQRSSQVYSLAKQQKSLNNQINAGLGLNARQSSAESISRYPPPPQQQQALQQMQGNPSTNSEFYSNSPYGVDLTNMPGLDFLQSTDYDQGLDPTGIDINFGHGMDFQHDWSDGTGLDIFDGFFFGNSTG
jgi:hypothetical protein